MKEIQSGIGDTYFAWAGPTTAGKGAYFRIQGPAVFIEYAPQGQGDNNVDHIHTIYRDPTNDYADRMTQAVRGAVLAAARGPACRDLLSASPSAHRLDEYLQAARVSLAHTRVELEIDLTPGASVADGIISLIDRDGDKRISPLEAERYGRAVLADVVLELDGRPVALTLNRVEAPPLEEMRHGLGAIQVRASGDVEPRMSFRTRAPFPEQSSRGVQRVSRQRAHANRPRHQRCQSDARCETARRPHRIQRATAVAQVPVLAASWVGGRWLVVHEVARSSTITPLTTNHQPCTPFDGA